VQEEKERKRNGKGKVNRERKGKVEEELWIRQWRRGRKGEGQGEQLGLGRRGTSFSTLST